MFSLQKHTTKMAYNDPCPRCGRTLQILLKGGMDREHIITEDFMEAVRHEVTLAHLCEQPPHAEGITRAAAHRCPVMLKATPMEPNKGFRCGFCLQYGPPAPTHRWHTCTRLTSTLIFSDAWSVVASDDSPSSSGPSDTAILTGR